MNRFFSLRSLLSLALLWIGASALASGVKTAVDGVTEAAFLPVALFGLLAAYGLGYSKWTAKQTSFFILIFGMLVVFLETTRIREVLWQTLFQLPGIEFGALWAWVRKEPFHTLVFQTQWDEILKRMQLFTRGLLPSGDKPSLVLRELLWDIPILIVCAWSGWWSSRRNMILTALGPSLTLHAFLLNYTEKRTLTLQIAAFAFIFLMGIHQDWSTPEKESENENRVKRETYGTVFILSFVLAVAAGWAPVFSLQETARKIAERQNINETLGLEREVVQSYVVSSSGLPREHLISSPPQNLMTVVFTANTGERPILDRLDEEGIDQSVPHYYWRWLTYDLYNGKYWSTSPISSGSYVADETLFEFSGEGHRVIHQTISKASAEDGHLYWTGSLVRASQPFQSTWRLKPTKKDPLLHMDMLGSVIDAQKYSADSLVPQLNETQLREASQAYPVDIKEKYLALPGTLSQRVLDLAAQLTEDQTNAYDKARAIEAYLRTFPYTLDVPAFPPDKEISDYFLFELKTGYCDYYATSMAVLARASGLPTRLVIGYSGGDYNSRTAEYTVREINAHSWVEIYFPQIGWVEFEPTANQPAIERPLNSQDSSVSILATAVQKNRDGVGYHKQGHFVEKNFLIPILISMIAMVMVCLLLLYRQGLRYSHATINSIYEYIYYHGRKIYTDGLPNETPSLFAEKLKNKLMINHRFLRPAAGEVDRLTFLYLQETYSPHPITKEEQDQAVKIWRKLFWRLLYIRMLSN